MRYLIRWLIALLLGAAIAYVHITNAIAAESDMELLWHYARLIPTIGLVLAIAKWENKEIRNLGMFLFIADFLLSFLVPYAF